MAPRLLERLREAVWRAAEESGFAPESDERHRLLRHYALPLADRVLRHSSLRWAAEACRRRGWRMRIYGNGWESHPELAEFARGDVPHGEELRACYRSAAAHLHASANTLVHQRVLECALSGGLPLCRLTHNAVMDGLYAAKRAIAADLGVNEDVKLLPIDHPALAAQASLMQRLGLRPSRRIRIDADEFDGLRSPDGRLADGVCAPWLLCDLAETSFSDGPSLETLLARAVERPEWRASLSRSIAERARARCSTDVLASRMLATIGRSLASARRRSAA